MYIFHTVLLYKDAYTANVVLTFIPIFVRIYLNNRKYTSEGIRITEAKYTSVRTLRYVNCIFSLKLYQLVIWNNLLRCCWIDNTMETWKIISMKRAKNSFLNQCMNRQKGLDKWKSTQHIKWCGYTTTRKILDYTDILISCIWISIYLLRGDMYAG